MRRLAAALILCASLAPSGALAQEVPPCRALPPVAWDAPPVTTFPAIRHLAEVALPNVTGAKALYLRAMCGVQNASVWQAIDRGTGALLEIPAPLAASLDRAVPYLPTVRHLYVRGGGRGREVVVFLFAEGLDTRYFRTDGRPWTDRQLGDVVRTLDAMPYELLRQASMRLHDFSTYESELRILPELRGLVDLFGDGNIARTTAGMAPWNGHCLLKRSLLSSRVDLVPHELVHYVDWYRQGRRASGFVWTDDFGRISFTNGRVLGVRIPFNFRVIHEPARRGEYVCFDCGSPSPVWAPWGFTTNYATMNPAEDLAETVVTALAGSQRIREAIERDSLFRLRFDAEGISRAQRTGFYDQRLLYERTGDDGAVLGEKARFVFDLLGLGRQPQDADGDGVPWVAGRSPADCDDGNPVEGVCSEETCRSDRDCDDGDPCTDERCVGSVCEYPLRDSDGDGSPDGACGGTDCADGDPSVRQGSARACTNRCGERSTQSCVGPSWSACAAPASCGCAPGARTVRACGSRCGVTTLTCSSRGEWIDPGVCDPGSEGVCAAGATRHRTETFHVPGCGTQTTRVTERCLPSCSGWVLSSRHVLSPASSPEVCDGADNDCDGTVDEGCPTDVTLSTPSPTPMLGESSGVSATVGCPPGQVLAGVELDRGRYSQPFSSTDIVHALRPVCVRPALGSSGSPHRYTVTSGLVLSPMAWHGPSPHEVDAGLLCPFGQFVVGARVRTYRPRLGRRFLETIQLECAPLSVRGTRGSFSLSRGPVSRTASHFARPVDEHQACPGPRVATGMHLRYSMSDPDGFKGFALHCSEASLRLVP